jgi:hypothetical protein
MHTVKHIFPIIVINIIITVTMVISTITLLLLPYLLILCLTELVKRLG